MAHAYRKWGPYFGKDVLRNVVYRATSAFGVYYFAKNAFLLGYYREYIELRGNRRGIEPSNKLQLMVSEVVEELKDRASEYTPIVPVLVPGLQIFHAGTLGTSNGGFIGFPIWFEFNTKEDVSNQLVVKKEDGTVAMEDDDVYNCFVLSDSAKKYVIARETLLINTPQVYMDAFMLVPLLYIIDLTTINLVKHIRLASYPLATRGFFYIAVTMFGLTLWWNIHKNINMYYQSKAENQITQLSNDYIEGGLEFYSKQIERDTLKVELKNQKTRIVKFVEDLIRGILPLDGFPSTFKIAFLKSHIQRDNKELA